MSKNKKRDELNTTCENDVCTIKMLLVLLVNKMGVDRKDIATALGVSQGRLSQLLNPKKYKS